MTLGVCSECGAPLLSVERGGAGVIIRPGNRPVVQEPTREVQTCEMGHVVTVVYAEAGA